MRAGGTRVAALLFVVQATGVADAARYRDAVRRTFSVTGQAAVSVARLLAIDASTPAAVSLELGKSESWAVHLLEPASGKQPRNSGEAPPRFNTVEFSPHPVPVMRIGPYWLDQATALPVSRPGLYSIGSPLIPEALGDAGPWTELVTRLKGLPEWNDALAQRLRRCFAAPDATEVCIEVHGMVDWERNAPAYKVVVSAR